MQSLLLASSNPETRALIKLTAQRLNKAYREVDLKDLLEKGFDSFSLFNHEGKLTEDFLLIDAEAEDIYRLSVQLNVQGIDPRRHMVRLLDRPWQRYYYHDLPIFASVLSPANETDAAEIFQRLDRALSVAPHFLGKVIGESLETTIPGDEKAQHVEELARDLAPLSVDIMLIGETGTGKDKLAREIHQKSGRSGPFIAINCAAIPETLAESELFGVEAGAFTGAAKSRAGRIEAAHQGTLYLDEIDSMPLALQAKLLRALQERGIERLGSHQFITSDFRVIASTKVALERMVEENLFRRDLMYRLNVVVLNIPPLRDRPKAILELFRQFTSEAAKRFNRSGVKVYNSLEQQLLAHSWPGNIRELKAAAERYALGINPLGEEVSAVMPLRDWMKAVEKVYIESTLNANQQSVQRTCEILQVPIQTLYYRMRSLGIERGNATD